MIGFLARLRAARRQLRPEEKHEPERLAPDRPENAEQIRSLALGMAMEWFASPRKSSAAFLVDLTDLQLYLVSEELKRLLAGDGQIALTACGDHVYVVEVWNDCRG